MRIKSKNGPFLAGIQSVIGVITSKNTLPILSNFLLEAEKRELRLTATDLDVGMINTIKVEVFEEGAITVPAKRLVDIIKELPNDADVEICAKRNNTVVIESEGVTFKLLGVPREEFPKLPEFSKEEQLVLKQEAFKRQLDMTSFAMSYDETRYVLNGICFIASKDAIRMVATDGRRLAIIDKKTATKIKGEKKIIIPTKTVQELLRALKGLGDIVITFSKNQAMFQIERLTIVSRLIEGEFPNYEQAIPKQTKNRMRVGTEVLLPAIRRANLLTTPESQAIKLQLQKNKLTITKSTPEIGEVREDVTTEYNGEELAVGFNPTYLLDVLKNIAEERVDFELTGAEKPGVIRVDKEGYTYIVLPMQIM